MSDADLQERTQKSLPDFDGLFRESSLTTGIDLSIRGLGKAFGEKQILRGLDLTVPAGQFVAVVGRSGCGKSTLLRLVAGLEQASTGEIRFGEGSRLKKNVHPVRVMFQEPRLLPWARVLANVEIGFGMESLSAENKQKALDALQAVGLGERAQEWPSVLSGGQKQRVALARALVSKPRLLAFDEPLGALDALTRIEMQGLLERIWLRDKFTALLVTHDVSEALTLADRVIMIENGRISLDLNVDLPRPRRRGSVDLALLEEKILNLLLRNEVDKPEYEI